jgi:hypothetical protein
MWRLFRTRRQTSLEFFHFILNPEQRSVFQLVFNIYDYDLLSYDVMWTLCFSKTLVLQVRTVSQPVKQYRHLSRCDNLRPHLRPIYFKFLTYGQFLWNVVHTVSCQRFGDCLSPSWSFTSTLITEAETVSETLCLHYQSPESTSCISYCIPDCINTELRCNSINIWGAFIIFDLL